MPKIFLLTGIVLTIVIACTQAGRRGLDANPEGSRISAPPVSSAMNFQELQKRPLRLPSIMTDEECPVSPSRDDEGSSDQVLGNAPIGPVAIYFGKNRVLQVDQKNFNDNDKMYEKKVPWMSTEYRGPILIRTERIDGRGDGGVKFQWHGRAIGEGIGVEVTSEQMALPGSTRITGPGCYAYQIDGTSFSEVIVFRVELT